MKRWLEFPKSGGGKEGEGKGLVITVSLVAAVSSTLLLTSWARAQRGADANASKKKNTGGDIETEPKALNQEDLKNITRQGFAKSKIPKHMDVIIIGSGMGGLTTAALLAKEGKKVLVLEQHDVAGGNTHTFEEKGYEFDTGLHYIGGDLTNTKKGGSPLSNVMNAITGGNVKWARMDDNYDIAVVQSKTSSSSHRECFEMHKSWKVLIAKLKQEFPEDHKAIDQFFTLIKGCEKWSPLIFGLKHFRPAFLSRIVYYIMTWTSANIYLTKTVSDVVNDLTTNEKLRGIFGYIYGDYGEIPSRGSFFINCLVWNHYRGGAYYPIGGPIVIPQSIIPIIEQAGGKVLVRAPVSKILMKGGSAIGVEVKGETNVYASTIVSSVGAPKTYKSLIPSTHHSLVQNELTYLENPNIQSNISLMSLFIGFEGDNLELPKSNLWVYPSWDHNENWKAFQNDDESIDFPAVFISFSSAKDPTFQERHPNKQVALVIAPCDFKYVEKYGNKRVKHRGDDYEELKSKWETKLLEIFFREFPQLKDRVQYKELGTAVTNDYYLGTYRGAVYGLGHTPERFAQQWLTPKTSIKNLYLTGQDVVCCGICGAMIGGIFAAGAISKGALRHAL